MQLGSRVVFSGGFFAADLSASIHYIPNVLLASNEAGVVIQQALPSPTSSSVITQVPSSSRPIV
ncbi:hypothetical protein M9458_019349, partial [Cirrhinus mrigala]